MNDNKNKEKQETNEKNQHAEFQNASLVFI